jgi:hypothetical protein
MDAPDRDFYYLAVSELEVHIIHSLVSQQLDTAHIENKRVLESLLNLHRTTKELTNDLH